MELVYLWVEDYKNIKNQGFNFSPRFTSSYENEKLTITKNENYIENFFGENINITAIVGENGSGKSSIGGMYITEKFINKSGKIGKCILIINKKDILYTYNDTSKKLNFEHKSFLNIEEYNKVSGLYNSLCEEINEKDNFKDMLFDDFNNRNFDINNCSFEKEKLQFEFDFLKKTKKKIFDIFSCKKDELELFIVGRQLFCILSEFSSRDNNLNGNSYRSIRPLERGDINNFEERIGSISLLRFFIRLLNFNHKILNNENKKKFEINDETVSFGELSFGEKYSIHTLISIYHRIKNNKESIFFLDEVTLSMHPTLEKKFIYLLIKTVEKAQEYSDEKVKVHFIITSHSPFIISDLPKENVIFLKDGKQKDVDINTFGANIHTLLSHGFFMEDGLMGEFAKSKINDIKEFYEKVKKSDNPKVDFQEEYNSKIENFKYIQKIIGEPFLQTIIKNYLDELEVLFYGKNQFLDNEIERLKNLKSSFNDHPCL